MWASTAKFQGSSKSKLHSIQWQESRDGNGGWLASGSAEGTVGVSWIASRAAAAPGQAVNVALTSEARLYKSHFMMKGHIGEVKLVRWAPNGVSRLASYDSWGRIIIYQNRANVLAYQFKVKTGVIVADMQWSPCGYYIAICGNDGHIQMLSAVNGMALFAVQVEAANHRARPDFTCCAWNEPGTRVALGTSNGEILLLNPADNGSNISTISLRGGLSVLSIEWYGEVKTCHETDGTSYKSQSLSVYLNNGDVILFKAVAHTECVCSKTRTVDGIALWNSTHTLLAVVGYKKGATGSPSPIVRFLDNRGYVLFTVSEGLKPTPRPKGPVDSISWALDNSALLVVQGSSIYSIDVQESLSSLEHLCRRYLTDEALAGCSAQAMLMLPLPVREIKTLSRMTSQLIPDPFPKRGPNCVQNLFKPLPSHQRLHCLLTASEDGFTLNYEFLNHFVPLLQAVRKPKRVGILQNGYFIEPAFDPISSSEDLPSQPTTGGYWASQVPLTSSLQRRNSTPRRSRRHRRSLGSSFMKKLKLAVTPGQVVDATHQDPVARDLETNGAERPLLAEVKGRSCVNRFQFHTDSSLFQDGDLGSMSISTSYVKCRPRKVDIHLAGRSKEAGISMCSKSPDWNERFRIYELDFGGRVARDSIKNFQIDQGGCVVFQFGRAGKSQYCLDFQAPFSPVQAFCVALACVL